MKDGEEKRLAESRARDRNWQRWGPYLSERQWGTVREDYSADASCWDSFPHDHARSRAYRWGEDGLLGITDRECRLCFALALWNGRDPILKERLFGLTGPEGNHGEDVKECYYYLDSTPTHSYMKALYKYPHSEFPYAKLLDENRRRGKHEPEFELLDTGIFSESRYFDVVVEYAKAAPDDILIRISVHNRGPDAAPLHLLPTLWLRNTWSWGRTGEGYWPKTFLTKDNRGVRADHPSLGKFRLDIDESTAEWIFTDNETNAERLYKVPNRLPHVKDSFHKYVIRGAGMSGPMDRSGINDKSGTKAAAVLNMNLAPGACKTVRLRLRAVEPEGREPDHPAVHPDVGDDAHGSAQCRFLDFDAIFSERLAEADEFYASLLNPIVNEEARRVARQAYAGLLWSKQFYHYDVQTWLDGDPAFPPVPEERRSGRNHDWRHLYCRDVLSMPDKWEYPWFAAWDTAFHTVAMADVDRDCAQDQLLLFLREWYMAPNGKIPAYEFAFSDVNPPVHAWACRRVYKKSGAPRCRDRDFLERAFQKMLLNFTWWVNRVDVEDNNLFGGGFLGLDNIGVLDRSKKLPTGENLEQADGTAWMAFYCVVMLQIALELAREDRVYEDMASKFFEHFIAISDAMNTFGGCGLWDEKDGFYYDRLYVGGTQMPLRVRSMVGLVPLFAVDILEDEQVAPLDNFRKRMDWFVENRKDLFRREQDHPAITCMMHPPAGAESKAHRLLAIPSKKRLERILGYVLDEDEFLSPYGIRSLSKYHQAHPFIVQIHGEEHCVKYAPGDSESGLFGGNSNWCGPVWMPMNYLLIESLERYHRFYGDASKVEMPTRSGRWMNLGEVAGELKARLARLFLPDGDRGSRPCHGEQSLYAEDPHWKNLILFYECFHGDNGRGLGASHQTGWTALAAELMEPR